MSYIYNITFRFYKYFILFVKSNIASSLLVLILTTPPAFSFEFSSDNLVTKVNEGLASTNQTWRFQKHDCGILAGSNLYNCRNNLQNSIELDSISNSVNDKANEVVLIWNGVDLFTDSFAYALAMVTKACSPEKAFNEINKKIATVLPRPSEKDVSPNDIPRRSIIIDGIEYAAKVQPNGFLMVTVKDTNVSVPN